VAANVITFIDAPVVNYLLNPISLQTWFSSKHSNPLCGSVTSLLCFNILLTLVNFFASCPYQPNLNIPFPVFIAMGWVGLGWFCH